MRLNKIKIISCVSHTAACALESLSFSSTLGRNHILGEVKMKREVVWWGIVSVLSRVALPKFIFQNLKKKVNSLVK